MIPQPHDAIRGREPVNLEYRSYYEIAQDGKRNRGWHD